VTAPPGSGTSPATGIPTCYRHPGRETYVSCVRCGRPACPDCLRSAAVGQQCVDCIKAGNRGTRQPQGMFGGRAMSGAKVTWALVVINVLLYIVELAHSSLGTDWAMLGLATNDRGQLIGVAAGQWYRLITAAFLPPPGLSGLGPLDIAFNLWALLIVGPPMERMLGPLRYLSVYLVSAVGGSVAYFYIAPMNQPALGASGAIFGLFGAWFVLARRLRMDSRPVIMLIVLNLVLGFVVPGIAWQAHVGGLLAGSLLTAAYAYAPRANRLLFQAGATIAVLVIVVVAVIVRDHQLDQLITAVRL
jgi:membrane associated rhomboid family serine protease